MTITIKCRVSECQVELLPGVNWYSGQASRNDAICKSCHKAAVRLSQSKSDRFREYQREYRETHPRVQPPTDATRLSNLKACRAYRSRNSGLLAKRSAEYRERYPDRVTATRAAQNAKRRGAPKGEGYDPKAVAAIFALAKSITALTGVVYEVDHLIPISKGGTHHQDNLVVMRWDINRAKSNKIIPELIRFFGRTP